MRSFKLIINIYKLLFDVAVNDQVLRIIEDFLFRGVFATAHYVKQILFLFSFVMGHLLLLFLIYVFLVLIIILF